MIIFSYRNPFPTVRLVREGVKGPQTDLALLRRLAGLHLPSQSPRLAPMVTTSYLRIASRWMSFIQLMEILMRQLSKRSKLR